MKTPDGLKLSLCGSLLLLFGLGPLAGCHNPNLLKDKAVPEAVSTAKEGSASGRGSGPGQATPNQEGSSTGGGSFGDESSLTILKWATTDLAYQIRNSSPEIYQGLPKPWTQEKLAQVIQDVEPTVEHRESYLIPEVNRYGQRLMFNYGHSKDGKPFLTATRLFVDSYSHYDVNSRPIQGFVDTIAEVKLKLIHEASHLLGYGLTRETDQTEARAFAKALLASLDSDNVECLPKSAPPKMVYTPLEAERPDFSSSDDTEEGRIKRFLPFTRAYVFNRPSGRAAVPTNLVLPGYKTVQRLERKQKALSEGEIPYNLVEDHVRYPIDYSKTSSGRVYVFAPHSYDGVFDLPNIKKSVFEGKRAYGYKEGYFSWNKVDLRRAVYTKEGYRSDYKYSRETDINNEFNDYLDFFIVASSAKHFEMETYPPLSQDKGNWAFYRSQGKAQIVLKFEAGKIVDSYLMILKDFSRWIGLGDDGPNDYAVKVPLQCVRSFKPLFLKTQE